MYLLGARTEFVSRHSAGCADAVMAMHQAVRCERERQCEHEHEMRDARSPVAGVYEMRSRKGVVPSL